MLCWIASENHRQNENNFQSCKEFSWCHEGVEVQTEANTTKLKCVPKRRDRLLVLVLLTLFIQIINIKYYCCSFSNVAFCSFCWTCYKWSHLYVYDWTVNSAVVKPEWEELKWSLMQQLNLLRPCLLARRATLPK